MNIFPEKLNYQNSPDEIGNLNRPVLWEDIVYIVNDQKRHKQAQNRNCSPISLMNLDLKILSKTLTKSHIMH